MFWSVVDSYPFPCSALILLLIILVHFFSKRQLPVPKILAASDDQLRYLQTDLGSMSLFDAIRGGREAGGRYTLKEQ